VTEDLSVAHAPLSAGRTFGRNSRGAGDHGEHLFRLFGRVAEHWPCGVRTPGRRGAIPRDPEQSEQMLDDLNTDYCDNGPDLTGFASTVALGCR
jgi:hypothetical protein